MIELATQVILFITFFALAGKRLLTYTHVLQQEEYDSGRMMKWILRSALDIYVHRNSVYRPPNPSIFHQLFGVHLLCDYRIY
jgi:hypothetical protein